MQDKFRIDELYNFLFVRPIRALSRWIFFVVDRIIIDKILVGGSAALVDVFGRIARIVQMGDGQRYMAVFAIGVAGLLYLATRPTVPEQLKVTVSGLNVDVDARRNGRASTRPLEYGFDFDDDGKTDVTGSTPSAHHVYPHPGQYTIRVRVRDPRWGTSDDIKQKVTVQ